MQNWFCSFFTTQHQTQSQMILVNNNTREVLSYTYQKPNPILTNPIPHGYILMKKSFYPLIHQQCKNQRKMFIDNKFPSNQISLGLMDQLENRKIVWKRLGQLYGNGEMVKGRVEPADVQQGNVGDCYFLAAISALAENQNNILSIFQQNKLQNLLKNQYGIYKVLINVGGQPEEVIIDDFIPVFQKSQRPVFCKPVNNQFWVVLLQKAWAKINGSYSNISVGNPHEVLNKFSVAPVFYHNIPQPYYSGGNRLDKKQVDIFEQKLWQHIMQGHKFNFPICCGTRSQIFVQGIKQCHSYTLLSAFEFDHNHQKYRILKIRNPWGDTQYTGPLNENDPFWNSVDISIRKRIFEKLNQNDGTFTIPYLQFLKNYESIDICHIKNSYNYIFKPVKFQYKKSKQKFFKLQVEQDGEIYLTFQKNYTKNYKQNKYFDNGVAKIMIAQQIGQKKYKFIDCAIQMLLADVTLRCKRLKRGIYIVLIECEDKDLNKNYLQNGTISTYSATSCTLSQIAHQKNFIEEFLSSHAQCENKQKTKVGAFENDWIARKLISQCGYGYITISLDQSGTKKLQLTINLKSISDAGFILTLPSQMPFMYLSNTKEIIIAEVQPSQFLTFIFKVDFNRDGQLRISFPPEGFDIKKII